MAKGRGRKSKILTSYVSHGHKGRHPGFAVSTFPAKGSTKGSRRSKRY